jgi:hypothetical protein
LTAESLFRIFKDRAQFRGSTLAQCAAKSDWLSFGYRLRDCGNKKTLPDKPCIARASVDATDAGSVTLEMQADVHSTDGRFSRLDEFWDASMVAADDGSWAESCQRQYPNLTQEAPPKRVARSPFPTLIWSPLSDLTEPAD